MFLAGPAEIFVKSCAMSLLKLRENIESVNEAADAIPTWLRGWRGQSNIKHPTKWETNRPLPVENHIDYSDHEIVEFKIMSEMK